MQLNLRCIRTAGTVRRWPISIRLPIRSRSLLNLNPCSWEVQGPGNLRRMHALCSNHQSRRHAPKSRADPLPCIDFDCPMLNLSALKSPLSPIRRITQNPLIPRELTSPSLPLISSQNLLIFFEGASPSSQSAVHPTTSF